MFISNTQTLTYVVVSDGVVALAVVPSEKDINPLLWLLTVTYIFILKINIKGYTDIGIGNILMYRVYANITMLINIF